MQITLHKKWSMNSVTSNSELTIIEKFLCLQGEHIFTILNAEFFKRHDSFTYCSQTISVFHTLTNWKPFTKMFDRKKRLLFISFFIMLKSKYFFIMDKFKLFLNWKNWSVAHLENYNLFFPFWAWKWFHIKQSIRFCDQPFIIIIFISRVVK